MDKNQREKIEFVAKLSEFCIDQSLVAGIAKDIPVIDLAFKVLSIKDTIQDRIYSAKISRFLTSLNDIPNKEKNKFRESIIDDKENINKLFEKVVMILDSITDLDKAEIIALLLLAKLDGQLNDVSFRRCVDITNTVFIDDLMTFINHGHIYQERTDNLLGFKLEGLIFSPLLILDVDTNDELMRDGLGSDIGVSMYSSSSIGSEFKKAIDYALRLKQSETGG
jgi:hypothetical protein